MNTTERNCLIADLESRIDSIKERWNQYDGLTAILNTSSSEIEKLCRLLDKALTDDLMNDQMMRDRIFKLANEVSHFVQTHMAAFGFQLYYLLDPSDKEKYKQFVWEELPAST